MGSYKGLGAIRIRRVGDSLTGRIPRLLATTVSVILLAGGLLVGCSSSSSGCKAAADELANGYSNLKGISEGIFSPSYSTSDRVTEMEQYGQRKWIDLLSAYNKAMGDYQANCT